MNCPCNPEKFHQEWATMWSSWNWPLKIFFCGQVLAPEEYKSKSGQWRRAASLRLQIRDNSSKSSPNPHAHQLGRDLLERRAGGCHTGLWVPAGIDWGMSRPPTPPEAPSVRFSPSQQAHQRFTTKPAPCKPARPSALPKGEWHGSDGSPRFRGSSPVQALIWPSVKAVLHHWKSNPRT